MRPEPFCLPPAPTSAQVFKSQEADQSRLRVISMGVGLVWRKRWFILWRGQTCSDEGVVEYYKNDSSKKPQRSIELSLCEAVNPGVTFQRERQPDGFVFGIQTRERTFYLLARTQEDMNKWVESISQICGLWQEEENTEFQENTNHALQSPTDPGKSKSRHTDPETYIQMMHKFRAHRHALYLNADDISPDVPVPGIPGTFTGDKNHEAIAVANTRSPAVARTFLSQKPDVHSIAPAPFTMCLPSARMSIRTNEPVPTLDEPPTLKTMKACRLEQLVNRLVPTMLRGDPFFLPSFLHFYRDFGTTQQVLDLLFQTTLCSILRTWLDRYPEDFCQSTDLSNLHRLMDYVQLLLPSSDLAHQLKLYLLHMEDPLLREPESKDKIQTPPIHRHLKPERKTKLMTPNLDCKAHLEQLHNLSQRYIGGTSTCSSSQDLGLGPAHGIRSRDRGGGKGTHIFSPCTTSLHLDEKVQYALVDQEKTQALQRTREEWAGMCPSQDPPKGTSS
ncbi:GRB2-associated-binding protein 2-like [Dipodomys merriami]|uniref:GRB2-associated-binding protein 2-like n=1 Tax=Dipodomys merriami TaxID=94247 RepID=UPI003855F5A3